MKTNKHLSRDQIFTLSELVKEQAGDNYSLELVTEIALSIFEDISGLESITKSEQQELIYDIWTDISKKQT